MAYLVAERVTPAVLRGPASGPDLLLWHFQTFAVVWSTTGLKLPLSPQNGPLYVPFFRMEPDNNNTDLIYIGLADSNLQPGSSKWFTTLSPGEFFQAEQNNPWDALSGSLDLSASLPGAGLTPIELDHSIEMVDMTQFYGISGLNNVPANGNILYVTIGTRTVG